MIECKIILLQPVYICFKRTANANHILTWKSKGLSDEVIKPPTASNNSHSLVLNHIKTKL